MIAHSLFSCEEKNLRPGDWNCISCNQLNFRRRDSCQRCGEPRIGYHKGSFGGRISGRGPDVRPAVSSVLDAIAIKRYPCLESNFYI
ncbi:hypothetical protein ACOSQ2_004281 [Xanthoceras sorbifolium]